MNRKNRGKLLVLIMFILVAGISLFVSGIHYQNKLKESAVSSSNNVLSKSDSFSPKDVHIYAIRGNVDIYLRKDEVAHQYIGYKIRHFQKELDNTVPSSNYDVWKLDGANEYERNKYGDFSKTLDIVASGEWEMAIKEQGANDFIGGKAHGDEVTTSIQLLVDGKEVDVQDFIESEATEIVMKIKSDLYRDNTLTEDAEKVGVHTKIYTFNKSGLTLNQHVEYEKDMVIELGYLAMLPILRESKEMQITDTYRINDQEEQYDVSSEDIPTLSRVEASKAEIFSLESGVSASVEIIEKSTKIPTMFYVWNAPTYNKMYFAYALDGYEVKSGDIWSQTTRYDINVNKQ